MFPITTRRTIIKSAAIKKTLNLMSDSPILSFLIQFPSTVTLSIPSIPSKLSKSFCIFISSSVFNDIKNASGRGLAETLELTATSSLV